MRPTNNPNANLHNEGWRKSEPQLNEMFKELPNTLCHWRKTLLGTLLSLSRGHLCDQLQWIPIKGPFYCQIR